MTGLADLSVAQESRYGLIAGRWRARMTGPFINFVCLHTLFIFM